MPRGPGTSFVHHPHFTCQGALSSVCVLLLLVPTLPRHAACLFLLSLMQCFFYIPHAYKIPIPKSKDECWEVGSVCILFALQVWGPKFDYPELMFKKINGHIWWLMLIFPALVKKEQRNPRVCWPTSLANLMDSRPIRDPISKHRRWLAPKEWQLR